MGPFNERKVRPTFGPSYGLTFRYTRDNTCIPITPATQLKRIELNFQIAFKNIIIIVQLLSKMKI